MANSTCSVEPCINKAMNLKSGYCGTHYRSMRLYGNLEGLPPEKPCSQCGNVFQPDTARRIYCSIKCARDSQKRFCGADGCDKAVRYNGKCRTHAHKDLRRDIRGYRPCLVCGEVYGYTYTNRKTCSSSCASSLAKRTNPKPGTKQSSLSKAIEAGDNSMIIAEIQQLVSVDANGCWLWSKSINTSGYPIISHKNKRLPVHRLALESSVGAQLGQLDAHHSCATPRCVNPDHLVPAHKIDNIIEMRNRRGYEQRIQQLESALRSVAPDHPILAWS